MLTFAWPAITALVPLLFIAGWAIATWVLQIVGAIRLRKEIDNEWLLIASGVLSVVFGLILVVQPGTGGWPYSMSSVSTRSFTAFSWSGFRCACANTLRVRPATVTVLAHRSCNRVVEI
jgi:Short repeat of unknown function (DUF308)